MPFLGSWLTAILVLFVGYKMARKDGILEQMRTGLRMLILLFAISCVVHAQQGTLLNDRLTNILDRMGSNDLGTRETASRDLREILVEGVDVSQYGGDPGIPALRYVLDGFFARHPDQAERVKLGLIRLLETETRASKAAPAGSRTEDVGEYVFWVTQAVSALNDDRAIPPLAGAITLSGVDLLQYGDKALGPVIAQLRSPDELVRATALRVAATILETKKDEGRRTRVEDMIRSSLKDTSLVVRNAATQEIVCLDNREQYVPILEQIAKTDPTKLPGKAIDGGDGGEFYPVRYTARRILREIRDNKGCSH